MADICEDRRFFLKSGIGAITAITIPPVFFTTQSHATVPRGFEGIISFFGRKGLMKAEIPSSSRHVISQKVIERFGKGTVGEALTAQYEVHDIYEIAKRFSQPVQDAVAQGDVETIWHVNDNNYFSLYGKNKTDQYIIDNLYIVIVDPDTQKDITKSIKLGSVIVPPYGDLKLNYSQADGGKKLNLKLPKKLITGRRIISGQRIVIDAFFPTTDAVKIEPSEIIVVETD